MADDHDRAEFVRRLVLARCPELSTADLKDAFGDSAAPDRADVLAEIANCVTDAIEELEERLDKLEKDLPRRVH
jgi:hypothetical protein